MKESGGIKFYKSVNVRNEIVYGSFFEEIQIGNLKIELSVEEEHGRSKVIFTARDEEDRRVWRTPLMDLNGDIKLYRSQEEAIIDAERKLGAAF